MKEATVEMSGSLVGVNRDLSTVELDNKAVVKATIYVSKTRSECSLATRCGSKCRLDLRKGRIVYRSK